MFPSILLQKAQGLLLLGAALVSLLRCGSWRPRSMAKGAKTRPTSPHWGTAAVWFEALWRGRPAVTVIFPKCFDDLVCETASNQLPTSSIFALLPGQEWADGLYTLWPVLSRKRSETFGLRVTEVSSNGQGFWSSLKQIKAFGMVLFDFETCRLQLKWTLKPQAP